MWKRNYQERKPFKKGKQGYLHQQRYFGILLYMFVELSCATQSVGRSRKATGILRLKPAALFIVAL